MEKKAKAQEDAECGRLENFHEDIQQAFTKNDKDVLDQGLSPEEKLRIIKEKER